MQAGQCPELFWRLTFREINVILEGVSDRLRYEHNERMRAAWHVEAFARTKRLPKLKDVLISDQPKGQKRMTPEQLLAVTRQWMAKGRR